MAVPIRGAVLKIYHELAELQGKNLVQNGWHPKLPDISEPTTLLHSWKIK